MKTRSTLIFLLLLSVININGQESERNYLKKVLTNLEKIESASYNLYVESWEPGDTLPTYIRTFFYKEYANPQDSTIGSSYVALNGNDTTRLAWGYNGQVSAFVDNNSNSVIIDDFTSNREAFRPINTPFINNSKNIIKYTLETQDNIEMQFKETDRDFYFKLTINEDTQVEFFGKAYHMPEVPFYIEPTSIYEVWINKENGLPYKIRREMFHNIYLSSCSDMEQNKLSLNDFDLYAYFPKDFEIRNRNNEKKKNVQSDLQGQKAPEWSLKDQHGNSVSLTGIKSKVILLNLTGIGCGACHASIPFLNSLKEEFGNNDFELVAIETWKRTQHSIQNYITRNKISYKFLEGKDEIVKDYRTGGAAPYFFILDENRIIRKIIFGYGTGKMEEEIRKGIKELL